VTLPQICEACVTLPGIRNVITKPTLAENLRCRSCTQPGWTDDQINEPKSFTDGRIIVIGAKARRRPSKRADYLLRFARDFMLAVVEAKSAYKLPGDGP
jgi:type I site-specific restriction endonuclease